VIAEGVESPAQLRRLMELGCEFAQGFLFSHPLSEEAAGDLLRRRKRWDLAALSRGEGHAAE
jgi:EAL domain-containing protein (putative c-di-GMP-specific phosphodiesterase class I)